MAWKRLFKRDPLIKIMLDRGYVFNIDEELISLTVKIRRTVKWVKNREQSQKELLKLIKEKPRFFDFIYKFLNFVFDDRKHFRLRLELPEKKNNSKSKLDPQKNDFISMGWDHRHRPDILEDLVETRKKLSITKKELIKILRLFFLAAPELFVKDKKKNGENFYVIPKTEDALYFLIATQKELTVFYNGLSLGKRSRFLKSWLGLLRVRGY